MSSKRAVRRKACKGKFRHADAGAARSELSRLIRSKGYNGAMNAYACRWCGGWHIGHTPGKLLDKIAASRAKFK